MVFKPAGATLCRLHRYTGACIIMVWYLCQCYLTWTQPGDGVRNSFPTGGTTSLRTEARGSPPQGLVSPKDTQRGGRHISALSSSAKTKLMKNYYVYLIKSYTVTRSYIHQKKPKQNPQTLHPGRRENSEFLNF